MDHAVLDLTRLHEASISNRKDAIRAMDELCRRVMDSVYDGEVYNYQNFPSPRPQFAYPPLHRNGSSESLQRAAAMPGYHGNVPMPGHAPNQYGHLQRMQSTRQDNNMMVQRGMSQASHASSAGWLSPQYHRRQNDMRAFHRANLPEEEEYESREIQIYADLERMSNASIQDSAIGSDGVPRRHRTGSSVNSSAPTEYPRASFASDESVYERQHKDLEKMGLPALRTQTITRIEQPRGLLKEISPSSRKQSITTNEQPKDSPKELQKELPSPMRKPVNTTNEHPRESQKDASPSMRKQSITSNATSRDVQDELAPSTRTQSITSNANTARNREQDLSSDSEADQSSVTSRAASSTAPSGNSRSETAESMVRAMYAPEVVTKEYESMLSQQRTRPSVQTKRPNNLVPMHPALRLPFNHVETPTSPVPEPDSVWLPLPRPARHNNYHGFCKGAWQIRKSVRTKYVRNSDVEQNLTSIVLGTRRPQHTNDTQCKWSERPTLDLQDMPLQIEGNESECAPGPDLLQPEMRSAVSLVVLG